MYRKLNSGWLKHLDFELLDILCMEISFFLAFFIRHRESGLYRTGMYLRLGIILIFIDIVVVFFSNNYQNIIQRTKWVELFAAIRHVTVVQLLLLVYTYLVQESENLSRTVFFLSWGISVILCTGVRWCWKRVLRRRLTLEKNQTNMLLITTEDRIVELNKSLKQKVYRGFKISGIALLHEGLDEVLQANIPILYGKEKLLDHVRQEVVDEVLIDYYENPDEISDLTDVFLSMGITVHIGTGFLPDNLPNRIVEEIGGETVFTTSLNMAREWELLVKRLMDIVGSLVGIIFTGLIALFVAPAIKIADPGPILFKQQRVGKNGRTFNLYKFRTMVVNAEELKEELQDQNEMDGHMFKMEHDPRIIGANKKNGKGLGHFLRSTSLDEFPQFFNVLKGDMSLVGTRPPTVNEFEQYDLHHKIRLSMKPGITGVWQVSGRNAVSDFEKVVEMDAYYIENWNLGLDIKILFKTVGVLFKKDSY